MKKQKAYHARHGSPFKEKYAQTIGVFIHNCKDKTTRGILKQIRKNPKHIVHSLIEWNDKKASELFRLQQVRGIVNHIEIEIVGIKSDVPIKGFFSIRVAGKETYKDLDSVFSNQSYRKQIIGRAKSELENWMERYHIYNELQRMCKVIGRELKK